jgi:hypothetical protein
MRKAHGQKSTDRGYPLRIRNRPVTTGGKPIPGRHGGTAQFQLTVSFRLTVPEDGVVSDRLALQVPLPG